MGLTYYPGKVDCHSIRLVILGWLTGWLAGYQLPIAATVAVPHDVDKAGVVGPRRTVSCMCHMSRLDACQRADTCHGASSTAIRHVWLAG
jgi:hypothetical protein